MSYQVKSSTFSRIYAGNHLSAMELGGGMQGAISPCRKYGLCSYLRI